MNDALFFFFIFLKINQNCKLVFEDMFIIYLFMEKKKGAMFFINYDLSSFICFIIIISYRKIIYFNNNKRN